MIPIIMIDSSDIPPSSSSFSIGGAGVSVGTGVRVGIDGAGVSVGSGAGVPAGRVAVRRQGVADQVVRRAVADDEDAINQYCNTR